ncbi:MAG: Tad domain-containing protein, partial [Pseudomonadota bacterium]
MTFFVLMLSIGLMAMSGLVIDSGRTFAAHTQMQSFVDQTALAIANELDGQPRSLQRAQEVQDKLSRSSTLFGEVGGDGETFQVQTVKYLSGQPTSKGSRLDPTSYADLELDPTNPAEMAQASHVLVVAQQAEVEWTFLNLTALVAGMGTNTSGNAAEQAASGGDFEVTAWAVAELVIEGEEPTQELLAVCMPGQEAVDALEAGQQLRLNKSRNGAYEAGSYAIISNIADDENNTCGNLSGAAETACLLAINEHDVDEDRDTSVVSFVSDDTQLGTGQDEYDVAAGLNTRFGLYENLVSQLANSSAASPDTNTITGEIYSCAGESLDQVSESTQLPIDECFSDGSCTYISEVLSQDDLDAYCELTHGMDSCPDGITSRFDMYQYEVDNGLLDPRGDEAPNACNSANEEELRRVVPVAFVQCDAGGGVTQGQSSQTDVPVLGYGELLMTSPASTTTYFVATFDNNPAIEHDFKGGDVLSTHFVNEYGNNSYDVIADPYDTAQLGMT